MNIQIWGRSKCFDTKKAERYFKERGIKFQSIDIDLKGLSAKELDSVASAVGGFDNLMDKKSKAYEELHVAYLVRSVEDKKELFMSNFKLFQTPIVRNGRQATVGYAIQTWKEWEALEKI